MSSGRGINSEGLWQRTALCRESRLTEPSFDKISYADALSEVQKCIPLSDSLSNRHRLGSSFIQVRPQKWVASLNLSGLSVTLWLP